MSKVEHLIQQLIRHHKVVTKGLLLQGHKVFRKDLHQFVQKDQYGHDIGIAPRQCQY